MHRCSDEDVKSEWKQFKIVRVDKFGDYKLIIYQFPKPRIAYEAKYAALMINTRSFERSLILYAWILEWL